MLSLSKVIEVFSSIFRFVDDLLDINNIFFHSMVNHIYPSKLQLNKANISDSKDLFLALNF